MRRRAAQASFAAAASIGAAIVIAAWAALASDGHSWLLAADCVLGWTLLALAWIDFHSMRLPDVLTLPLLLLGLVTTAALTPAAVAPDELATHLIGAVAGFAVFALIGAGYRLARGRDGLGRGDAKLLAAGGAWVGWQALPSVVLLAAVTGLGFALAQRMRGRAVGRETPVPFGPAIALAIWIVRLYGYPGQE